ncbi:hypothetical protein VZO05_01440 [Aggregatilineales bacterium SYSU G02658]
MRGWALLLLGVLTGLAGAQNELELSAVLTVQTAGVEVLRVATERWLPVSAGSVMPIGSGDRLRTDETGRVKLAFEGGLMLLLPESELQLIAYEPSQPAGVRVEAGLVGVVVQRWESPPSAYALRLDDGPYTLTSPGVHSAVWSLPDLTDSLAVAQGEVVVSGAVEQRITAGQMAWLSVPAQVVTLSEPFNNARLEGALFGCAGSVKTDGGQNLLVRRGIGTGYQALGFIPDREPISAMAINESENWVRIQFRNHFGWVLRLALDINCPDLLRLPNNLPPERLYSVTEYTAEEVELLRPFYGEPRDDPFFYVR